MAERLRRQVKVSLAQIPGHESGVGSSPTLINIKLSFCRFFDTNFLPEAPGEDGTYSSCLDLDSTCNSAS
jgi:hypothetical protein